MKNKCIQLLLEEIRKLELKVSNLKENQNVSFSFFKESFKQTQEINRLLHELEFVQIEDMKSQMEKLVQFLSEAESSKSETPKEIEAKQTEDDENENKMRDIDLQSDSAQEKITQEPDNENKKEVLVRPIISSSKETHKEEIIEEFTHIEDEKKDKESDLSKTSLKTVDKFHEKGFVKEDLSDNLNINSVSTTNKSLNDIQPSSHTILDTKKSISLNDRFLFQRELFNNDRQAMSNMMQKLQEFKSYDECEDYLRQSTDWDFKDKTVEKFLEMLKKST